jgi:hypothetical protein
MNSFCQLLKVTFWSSEKDDLSFMELDLLTKFLFWPMHELVYIICVLQHELDLSVTESNILKFWTGRPKFYWIDTSDSFTEYVWTAVYALLKHEHTDYHAQMPCGVEHGTHDSPAHLQRDIHPLFAYDTVYLISLVCKERLSFHVIATRVQCSSS